MVIAVGIVESPDNLPKLCLGAWYPEALEDALMLHLVDRGG